MNLIEKIKAIEIYVCENFEELGLDDPVEEEYFSAYEEIKGASDKELQTFEENYGVSLPEDWKSFTAIRTAAVFQHAALRIGKRRVCIFPLVFRTDKACKGILSEQGCTADGFS